jgi:hypothetical protein
MRREDISPPATVTCERCGEDIVPIEAEQRRGGGLILAFACPKCKHQHPFGFLTLRGVALRERLRKKGWPTKRRTRDLDPLLKAYRRELHPIVPPRD